MSKGQLRNNLTAWEALSAPLPMGSLLMSPPVAQLRALTRCDHCISHSGQWGHREPIQPSAPCMGNSQPARQIPRQLRAPSGSHLDHVNPNIIWNCIFLLSLGPIVVMRHHSWCEAQNLFHVTALATNSIMSFFQPAQKLGGCFNVETAKFHQKFK